MGWRAFSQVEIQGLFGKLFRQVGKFQLAGSSGFCGWFLAAQGKRQLGQVLPRSQRFNQLGLAYCALNCTSFSVVSWSAVQAAPLRHRQPVIS